MVRQLSRFNNQQRHAHFFHAGKAFYLELDGEGRHPVFHFGMTGMLQVCFRARVFSVLKKLLSIASSEERCQCTTERLPGVLPRSGHLVS